MAWTTENPPSTGFGKQREGGPEPVRRGCVRTSVRLVWLLSCAPETCFRQLGEDFRSYARRGTIVPCRLSPP